MTQHCDSESKEVSWIVDGIPVYGTLTVPTGTESRSAIVFVAGSGPTDRNWCSPLLPGKNGSAKLIAEALSHSGLITLRYDKRASGPHAQENMAKMIGKLSMQSHTAELAGAVKTVISEHNVDPSSLFALTNSEGAIHALNCQLQATINKFKGLILTGAPGQSVGQVAHNQIENQIKALPNADVLMKHYDDAIAAFVSGKPVAPDISLPEGMQKLLFALTNPANLPFSRELWTYNPSDYIAKVQEPILVIIGKKDIQVDWQTDGRALEAATDNRKNVSFTYPENADHVLKHEEKPREKLIAAEAASRYNAEDRKLDKDALNAILNWLIKHT